MHSSARKTTTTAATNSPRDNVAPFPPPHTSVPNPLALPTKPFVPAVPEPVGELRLLLPTRYTKLEPSRPLSAFNDDPLFNPKAAARILAVSVECLKKWRQRKRGPKYIKYGEDGPVRYAWSDLKRFRSQHAIVPEENL